MILFNIDIKKIKIIIYNEENKITFICKTLITLNECNTKFKKFTFDFQKYLSIRFA